MSRGAGVRWTPLNTVGIQKHRPSRQARPSPSAPAKTKKGLSQISKMKSDSPIFKDLIQEMKSRRQNLTAEDTVIQRSVKNRPLLLSILFGCSGYAIIFSNKERPKRLKLILLQSFSTLYAKAMRKNCVSVFVFSLVKNLLNLKSCLITPNAPST